MVLRHPLTLITKETRSLHMKSGNTCLLLQDLHSPFSDAKSGWIATRVRKKILSAEFREYFDLLALITKNIPQVLKACREQGLHVAFSSLGYRNDQISDLQQATGWSWDLDGIDGTYPISWRPINNEPIFSKPGWSAMSNPAFLKFLEEKGITNVLIVGCMLDYGISQTSLDLSDMGISSLLVADAVAALTRASQDYVSGNLAHGLIKLRTTAEVLGILERLGMEGEVLV